MKFQKGLLNDLSKPPNKPEPVGAASPAVPKSPSKPAESGISGYVDKNRLFETQEELRGSSRNYLRLFGIVIVLIGIAAGAFFYFTLPGIGDQVRAPAGAEDAVRDTLLTKHKRNANEIVFYKCDGSYWARAAVETRNDIPNAVYKVGKYAAMVTQNDDLWEVSAQPITSPDLDVPCK